MNLKNHKEFIKKTIKLILQTRQRFKRERHNHFTEESNKTTLSSNMIKECNQLIQQNHIHMEREKKQ